MAWFAFVPIDVFRLQLFAPPPLWVSVFGMTLLLSGLRETCDTVSYHSSGEAKRASRRENRES